MITQLLMDFFFALVGLITLALPTWGAPSWLTDASGYLDTIWTSAAGLGAWLPWQLIGVVFAAVMLCMVTGLAIKLVRIVASFLTVGGGSAG